MDTRQHIGQNSLITDFENCNLEVHVTGQGNTSTLRCKALDVFVCLW